MENNPLREKMLPDEYVLREGKPEKGTFILRSIFNLLLPFSIVWILVDGAAIAGIFSEEGGEYFLIPFFLLHLMPVWLYLGNLIFAVRRYKHSWWLVTNRTVYVSSGIFSMSTASKTVVDALSVNVKRGIFEKMRGTGSIQIGSSEPLEIPAITEYETVEKLIRQYRNENAAELFYPNALRPNDEA